MNQLVNDLATAARSRSSLPKMPDALTIEQAYEVQRELVSVLADGPVRGLKAGMTAKAGQEAFGLTHPLIGSLYTWGELAPGVSFEFEAGVNLECEIGIVIDGAGKPKSAGPVIEVPRMAWSVPEDAKGANLTACNIAADRYIVGDQQPVRDSYEGLRVRLTRDGSEVLDAPLTDALGGPHLALDWMLAEAEKRGLAFADDMLLITGACGGIHPAERGSYIADYGELGSIRFTVT